MLVASAPPARSLDDSTRRQSRLNGEKISEIALQCQVIYRHKKEKDLIPLSGFLRQMQPNCAASADKLLPVSSRKGASELYWSVERNFFSARMLKRTSRESLGQRHARKVRSEPLKVDCIHLPNLFEFDLHGACS